MITKLSDVIDRWTILKMKVKFDPIVAPDLMVHQGVVMASMTPELLNQVVDVAQANARIWEQEAGIRKEYEADSASIGKLSLEEIGRRALRIRELNADRIAAKSAIDAARGDCTDRKFDHVSAPVSVL